MTDQILRLAGDLIVLLAGLALALGVLWLAINQPRRRFWRRRHRRS